MKKKHHREITLSDIAKELNVSKSTVSRALQDHPSIGKATKEAVRKLAKEYNYHVNSVASSLSKNSTKTIGVIVPLLSHSFFSTVISGVENAARQAGYKVIICQSAESYERETEAATTLLSSKVDCVIISISVETTDTSHLQPFIQKGTPVILFDRLAGEIEASTISIDDYKGAFTAVEHLIEQGYRRIAHFTGPPKLLITQNRMRGYHDALKKHNIPVIKKLIFDCGLQQEHGLAAAQKMLLETKELPDAIFAVCDPAAIGIMLALKSHGLQIPQDIAIAGFNNDPAASIIEPPLTTIAQPAFEMGEAAVHLFLNQLEDGKIIQRIFPSPLIIRKSS